MDSFVIRTYGRTELAQIYCPNLCPEAAFRKLKHWIDLCPDLRDGLSALGGSSRSRSYTPAQVRLIGLHLESLKPEVEWRKGQAGKRKGEVGTLGTEVHPSFRLTHIRVREAK